MISGRKPIRKELYPIQGMTSVEERARWFGAYAVSKPTPDVLSFCERISPGRTPFYISPQPPDSGAPHRCYQNVREHVRQHGGVKQLGWMIVTEPAIYLRAIHHAIHFDGRKYTDVSPGVQRRVLFLPSCDAGEDDGLPNRYPFGVPCRYYPLSQDGQRVIAAYQDRHRYPPRSPIWWDFTVRAYDRCRDARRRRCEREIAQKKKAKRRRKRKLCSR